MSSQIYKSLSIANPSPPSMNKWQLAGSAIGVVGLFILLLAGFNLFLLPLEQSLTIALFSITIGTLIYTYGSYNHKLSGIKNDSVWINLLTNNGIWGWAAGICITAFYILLYFFPAHLGLAVNGGANAGLIRLFDPFSQLLKGQPASQWFVYGALYTLAILIFGIKFIVKYRHNKYQIVRTLSVMFFQLGFAFLIPEFMQKMNYPYNDMKNMWPLNYYFFDEWNVKGFISAGNVGLFMIILGVAMIFIISPILTYYFGKRWYCSWVCGCGGLAETAGDPFRQLSDKSLKAWKIERWMIHLVLVFSTVMTIAVIFSLLQNNPNEFWINKTLFIGLLIAIYVLFVGLYKWKPNYFKSIDNKILKYVTIIFGIMILIPVISFFTGNGEAFYINSHMLRNSYGFYIGSIFSGVIGVGFYPIMGSRVWCRFGCPMAAVLGLQQKLFSRFRITTNGGQCISCGNCSTYCEMGIDVRSYAQKGQNIVRSSCVGCGICAAVCPRGVLRLENGKVDITERTDYENGLTISDKGISLN